MKITKRGGNVVIYDDEKVVKSVLKANAKITEEELSPPKASYIANEVFTRLTKDKEVITTQDVRDYVYSVLCEMGLPLTAKEYIEYKKTKYAK